MNSVISFVIGALSSFFVWFTLTRLIVPKLVIDDKIYKFKSITIPGTFIYKVKVTNKSRFFPVYDVHPAARVHIYGINPENQNGYNTFIIYTGAQHIPYDSCKQ